MGVCECLLKDSLTWVDHINGRKHNRALGMTMQVPVKSTDDVKARIAALKRGSSAPADDDEKIEARIKEAQEDEIERKRKKREKKKRKLDEENATRTPQVADKE